MSPLRPGDCIAALDASNQAQRTGVVVEVVEGPDAYGKYTVKIECRDRRKGATGVRNYLVLWPLA